MSPQGTNSIAVGSAHGTQEEISTDPERVEFESTRYDRKFDPYMVGRNRVRIVSGGGATGY